MQAAMLRFCMTARMSRPSEVLLRTSQVPTMMRAAKPMTNTRFQPKTTSLTVQFPDSHDGLDTWTLFEPKISFRTCCITSDTPQVASSDSSGRL